MMHNKTQSCKLRSSNTAKNSPFRLEQIFIACFTKSWLLPGPDKRYVRITHYRLDFNSAHPNNRQIKIIRVRLNHVLKYTATTFSKMQVCIISKEIITKMYSCWILALPFFHNINLFSVICFGNENKYAVWNNKNISYLSKKELTLPQAK